MYMNGSNQHHTRRWSERIKIEELGEACLSTFYMKKTPDDDDDEYDNNKKC